MDDITLLDEDVGLGTCDHEDSVGTTNVGKQCGEVPCPTIGMYYGSATKFRSFYKKKKTCYEI